MLSKIFGTRHPGIGEVLPPDVVAKFSAFARHEATHKSLPPTGQTMTELWFDFVIAVHQLDDDVLGTDGGAMIFQWLRNEGFSRESANYASTGFPDALWLLEYFDARGSNGGPAGKY